MKKTILLGLMFAGFFMTSQLPAQIDSKTYKKQPDSEHKKVPNATNTGGGQKTHAGTGKDQNSQAGGSSVSGATYTLPGEPKPGPTNQQGSVAYTDKTGRHIYNRGGEIMAIVEADGTTRDSKGKALVRCSDNGDYFGPSGDQIGTIKDGAILNKEGVESGRIGKDGKVTDAKGKLLGTINDDGTILNSKGSKIGSAPGVNKNISAMIFFNNKKMSSGDKKQKTQTQSGSEAKPIEKK